MHPLSSSATLESRSQAGWFQSSISAAVNRVMTFRPFGPRPVESAMQFATRGKLRCICMNSKVKRPGVERRQVCRTCGLESRKPLPELVDRQLTREEILDIVRSLQVAGIRGAQTEIPKSMTTLREVNGYLAGKVAPKAVEAAQNVRDLSAISMK